MKKALLIALVCLLAAAGPVLAVPPANVNFISERGVPFSLVLDGRPLTRGVAREVRVDRLVPGLHWADFTIPTAYGGAVRFRSRVWLEPGLETNYVLIARPGRAPVLQHAGAVALCGPARGGYGPGGNGYYGGGRGSYNAPNPYRGGGSSGNGGYNNSGQYPGGGYNNGGPYGNEPGGAGYYPGSTVSSYRIMAPQDVDALLRAVQQRPFEATKLSTAKEALSQSSIRAEDLQRLLRTLDFEASRVELAKYAHSHVSDPENFYRVYEAFEFEASVQEVQRAVGEEQP
jgi:hypothetical protein